MDVTKAIVSQHSSQLSQSGEISVPRGCAINLKHRQEHQTDRTHEPSLSL